MGIIKLEVKEWKDKLKPFYDKQGSIYCHAIQDNVIFNAYGWKHLSYHGNGKRRQKKDIQLRLGLLTWIPEVVKYCTSVRKTTTEVQNINGMKLDVIYFELCHSFQAKKKIDVVVIIRKIGTGKLHYWSVRYDKKTKKSV